METQSASGLLQFLQLIPDPRGREGQRHSHVAMLATMVCATLCNFPGYSGAVQWIRLQPLEFRHALGGKRHPPCDNAFRYLMMKLDPEALEEALMNWLTAGLGRVIGDEQLQSVVLDGKALRGTRPKHKQAMMIIAAFDLATGGVLSQTPVDWPTKESATALQLVKDMVLDGKVIIGDAAYCQPNTCETITSGDGDYVVMVKDNQPNLHKAAQQSFVISKGFSPLCSTCSGRADSRCRNTGEESWLC